MSEEKKTAAKPEKAAKGSDTAKKPNKFLTWCKNLPQKISKPFKNMWYELKKVSWPSKSKLIRYSVIVLVFMLLMGIVIGLLDMGASTAVRAMINTTEEAETTTDTATEVETTEDAASEEATDETAAEVEETADVATTEETASGEN